MKQEQQQRAAELRATGMTYRAIAEALGVGKSAVRRWLNPAVAELGRQQALERYRQHGHTLRGRCQNLLTASRQAAKLRGHEPVNISLQDLMVSAEAANCCYLCCKEGDNLQLEHDHSTGEMRGVGLSKM